MGVKFVLVIVVLAVLVFNEADAWSRLKRWGKKLTGGGQHNPAEVETGNEESHYHQPQQQSYYSSRRRRRSRSSYSRRRRSRRGDIEIAEQTTQLTTCLKMKSKLRHILSEYGKDIANNRDKTTRNGIMNIFILILLNLF
uniref:uncharacterized protein LOC120328378 isoform X2 n=1 Tax=Styela clava TaxID=7725 RepID=UPI0019398E70|nr:uncharacterized protein LOC120328378 isoform X2 [Styela clava]